MNTGHSCRKRVTRWVGRTRGGEYRTLVQEEGDKVDGQDNQHPVISHQNQSSASSLQPGVLIHGCLR